MEEGRGLNGEGNRQEVSLVSTVQKQPGIKGRRRGRKLIKILCDANCPKGLGNSAQGFNPEDKAGRLTYDRWRTRML